MIKPVIIKIGGSVVTDKHSEIPKINLENVKRIASEIAEVYEPGTKMIFIHGAGSYGHQIVHKYKLKEGVKTQEKKIAFGETQRLQNELDVLVTKVLIEKGIPAIPVCASSSIVMSNDAIKTMDTSAIEGFLKIGLVPVLYGVPAFDEKKDISILSGDDIAPYLAVKLGFKKIIHACDVDGVYTADPKKDKDARLIERIDKANINKVMGGIGGSTAVDVTGGMWAKVKKCMDVTDKGIESLITNALKPGNVKKALAGEQVVGTVIRA